MVTGICNIYINTPIKFHLFRETFPLVYWITDNWLVYIRWSYSKEAVKFIKESFPDHELNCVFFENLFESDWARSTTVMFESSKYDQIYLYWEDHFLIDSLDGFRKVINAFETSSLDYLQYSFFNIELPAYWIQKLYPDETEILFKLRMNDETVPLLHSDFPAYFPFSLVSISRKGHFKKLLEEDLVKFPIVLTPFVQKVINFALQPISFFANGKVRNWSASFGSFWGKFLNMSSFVFTINRLIRPFWAKFFFFPLATPFNLEKTIFDFPFFPIEIWVLKKELFANWDDDNGLSNSALIKRWLYPFNFVYKGEETQIEGKELKEVQLLKWSENSGCYYRPTWRTDIGIKLVKVLEGKIEILTDNESYILGPGERLIFHPNHYHRIRALEDAVYGYRIEDLDSQRVSYFEMV